MGRSPKKVWTKEALEPVVVGKTLSFGRQGVYLAQISENKGYIRWNSYKLVIYQYWENTSVKQKLQIKNLIADRGYLNKIMLGG